MKQGAPEGGAPCTQCVGYLGGRFTCCMSSRARFYSAPLSLQGKSVLILQKAGSFLQPATQHAWGLRGRAPSYRGSFEWLQLAIADELSVAPWYGQAYGSYAEPVFVGPHIRSTAAFRWGTDGGKAVGSSNGADWGDVVIQIRQEDVDAGVGLRGCAGSSEARNRNAGQ